MTPLDETGNDNAAGVTRANSAADLAAIRQSDCAAAVWLRPVRPAFRNWIDGLAPDELPRARMVLRPDDVRATVQQIFDARGTPDHAQRAVLAEDVAELSEAFSAATAARWLRLRFDVITTNACRRFHTDAVTARLVCTYRGTGTQYANVADGAAPAQVFTMPTGAPIVLRGTLWPERPNAGLRHRSPPIEGTGETRLVLVLDPLDQPDEEVDHRALH